MRNSMRWSSGARPVALGHRLLHLVGAGDGVDDAGELHQHAVAGQLDDAAAPFGNTGIDDLAAAKLHRIQCPLFVGTHHPAVADDIHCENSCKTAFQVDLGTG
jgi:hypothetical protein